MVAEKSKGAHEIITHSFYREVLDFAANSSYKVHPSVSGG